MSLVEIIGLMRPVVRFCDQERIPLRTTSGGKCAWSADVKRAVARLGLEELPPPPNLSTRFGTLRTLFDLCRRADAGEQLTYESIQTAIKQPLPALPHYKDDRPTSKEAMVRALLDFHIATGNFPQAESNAWASWTTKVAERNAIKLQPYSEYPRVFGSYNVAKDQARQKLMEDQHLRLGESVPSAPPIIEVTAELVIPEVMPSTPISLNGGLQMIPMTPLKPVNSQAVPKNVQEAAQGLISHNHNLQALVDEAQEALAERQARIDELEKTLEGKNMMIADLDRLLTMNNPDDVDAMVVATGKALWDNRELVTLDPARFRRFLGTFAHAFGFVQS